MSLAKTLAIVCVCLTAFLCSCSSKDSSIVLGFSQAGMQGIWLAANSDSIKDAAGKSGIQLHFAEAGSAQEAMSVPQMVARAAYPRLFRENGAVCMVFPSVMLHHNQMGVTKP